MKANLSNETLFLKISGLLTGFTETELLATGMLSTYYTTVQANSAGSVVEFFLENVRDILAKPKQTEAGIEQAIAEELIPSSNYNGLAQNIIILWYTGNWNNKPVIADSYIQGLMWSAGHTHPPGAKQPGYGSWAIPPFSANKNQ